MDNSEPVVSGAGWWDNLSGLLTTVIKEAGKAYELTVGPTVPVPAVPDGTGTGSILMGGAQLPITSILLIGAFGYILWRMAK